MIEKESKSIKVKLREIKQKLIQGSNKEAPSKEGELIDRYKYRYRLICPKCHAVGKHIKTVDDKERDPYYNGNIPMYAKKYVCKNCGHDWK